MVMTLPTILKELLVCPKCRGDLRFEEGQAEIHCDSCLLTYAIEDGVPNMLIAEARPQPRK